MLVIISVDVWLVQEVVFALTSEDVTHKAKARNRCTAVYPLTKYSSLNAMISP